MCHAVVEICNNLYNHDLHHLKSFPVLVKKRLKRKRYVKKKCRTFLYKPPNDPPILRVAHHIYSHLGENCTFHRTYYASLYQTNFMDLRWIFSVPSCHPVPYQGWFKGGNVRRLVDLGSMEFLLDAGGRLKEMFSTIYKSLDLRYLKSVFSSRT